MNPCIDCRGPATELRCFPCRVKHDTELRGRMRAAAQVMPSREPHPESWSWCRCGALNPSGEPAWQCAECSIHTPQLPPVRPTSHGLGSGGRAGTASPARPPLPTHDEVLA